MNEDNIPAWGHTKNYKEGDVVYYFDEVLKAKKDTQGHPEDGDWYYLSEGDGELI